MPLAGWGLHRFFENFRENSLKGDLSNDITLNPPLFSLVNTFKACSNTGFMKSYVKIIFHIPHVSLNLPCGLLYVPVVDGVLLHVFLLLSV
jgi:hypothetical protein